MKNLPEHTPALAYLRTSSATNVGGDSDHRQRETIQRYASQNGYQLVGEFYDAAVSGADPIEDRPGFSAMLDRIEGNGVRVVLVEDSSRFARSVIAFELGILALRERGVSVITASGEDLTETDDPVKVAMRQIASVFAQLEKARLVRKLKVARDRKSAELGHRVEGRKGYSETHPELVREAKRLARRNPKTNAKRSLRAISQALAELGFTTPKGLPFSPSQVQRLLDTDKKEAKKS